MRMKHCSRIVTGVALSALALGTAGAARAATFKTTLFSDFEPPTYTANADISGQDGWNRYGGGSSSVLVSPTSGGYTQLSGAHSMLHASSSVLTTRGFTTDVKLGQGTVLSWRYWTETLSASTDNEFGIMDGAGSGNMLAGIGALGRLSGNNHFKLVGDGADTDTGIAMSNSPYNNMHVYLLEMILDAGAGAFDAYATNETLAGPRTFLGTKAINTAVHLHRGEHRDQQPRAGRLQGGR